MYRRTYASAPIKAAPPEYKGHTYSPDAPKRAENEALLMPRRPEDCRGCTRYSEKKEQSRSGFAAGLLSHGINIEDILLLGLIFLLIKEGADELLIIALAYLFIAGM